MSKKVKEYRIHDRPVQDISALEPEATYSYADYLKWNFVERVELIKGKLFQMSPASARKHQEVSRNILINYGNFLKGKPCEVFSAPFDVRFPDKKGLPDKETFTVVQPDICVVCDLTKLDDAGCVGAPDLIVEIISPSTSSKDLNEKLHLYEEFGVKEYWVAYPNEKMITIFKLGPYGYSEATRYTLGQKVTSTVLIGLETEVNEIFEGVD